MPVRPNNPQILQFRTKLKKKQKKQSLRNGVRGDLVPGSVQIVNQTVIGPLVGDVKRGRYGTSVGVRPTVLKEIGV